LGAGSMSPTQQGLAMQDLSSGLSRDGRPQHREWRKWTAVGEVPLKVAVIGSGPSGCYAAEELMSQHGLEVGSFERLPTPGGLARFGVVPDHQ
jgi:NADPH-dependent glutamate synthase beta subunit-like oxidoreductase